ncbi:glycosyltransferase [Phenylobacterium sp.]|uniref:glycosyltransferase family 2 protein n=1 Tax=Phenylobacterium sp. TaxID=1871053 RepID=UPI002DEFA403|nr:glycosyltransferase [Phenylobacterium sp.]
MMSWADALPALARWARFIAGSVIVMGLAQSVFNLWQLGLAGIALRRKRGIDDAAQLWRRYAGNAPAIALLVPAYNETLTIVESVTSLISLQYPSFEVVVVNDGSTDDTLAALVAAFDLVPIERAHDNIAPHAPIRNIYGAPHQPRLVVVDKENGGKADALNAALNLSRAPIVCSVDADSLLEPDSLLRAVGPFQHDPERVIAVGGTVRLANGCDIKDGRLTRVGTPTNLLALLQTIEYLRAFLMARLAWSEVRSLLIISGAFGLFRRDAVLEIGGYRLGTVGEDMELVIRLHRHNLALKRDYRIEFVPEPVCWTQAPESLSVLARQRARWHRGALETFVGHSDMFFNPRFGRIGFLGFGYMLAVDVLGPLVEIAGYLLVPAFWILGVLDREYFFAFLAISFGFGVVMSVGALALEETELRRFPDVGSLLTLMGAAIVENFGYRQLNNLWRLWGTYQYVSRQHAWGAMARAGFRRA